MITCWGSQLEPKLWLVAMLSSTTPAKWRWVTGSSKDSKVLGLGWMAFLLKDSDGKLLHRDSHIKVLKNTKEQKRLVRIYKPCEIQEL